MSVACPRPSGLPAIVLLLVLVLPSLPTGAAAQAAGELGPGDARLEPTRIQPHRARWRIETAQGQVIGEATRTVDRVAHTEGEPAILVSFDMRFPQRAALDISYLEESTLLPIARYVTASDGMWVHYQSDDGLVASLTRRDGGAPVAVEVPWGSGRFNGGVVDIVLGSVTLEEGMAFRLPVLGTSGGREALTEHMDVAVEGTESVQTPDGPLETRRVRIERSTGAVQLLYVAPVPPYLVRREVLRGGTVVMRWALEPRPD